VAQSTLSGSVQRQQRTSVFQRKVDVRHLETTSAIPSIGPVARQRSICRWSSKAWPTSMPTVPALSLYASPRWHRWMRTPVAPAATSISW